MGWYLPHIPIGPPLGGPCYLGRGPYPKNPFSPFSFSPPCPERSPFGAIFGGAFIGPCPFCIEVSSMLPLGKALLYPLWVGFVN